MRITGLLHAQGIRDAKPFARGFIRSLEGMRTGDGRPLPPRLKELRFAPGLPHNLQDMARGYSLSPSS